MKKYVKVDEAHARINLATRVAKTQAHGRSVPHKQIQIDRVVDEDPPRKPDNTPVTALSLLLRVPERGHGSVVYRSPHPLHSMVPVVPGTNVQLPLGMQEPILFNYSIKENILYGKINANSRQINSSQAKK